MTYMRMRPSSYPDYLKPGDSVRVGSTTNTATVDRILGRYYQTSGPEYEAILTVDGDPDREPKRAHVWYHESGHWQTDLVPLSRR